MYVTYTRWVTGKKAGQISAGWRSDMSEYDKAWLRKFGVDEHDITMLEFEIEKKRRA